MTEKSVNMSHGVMATIILPVISSSTLHTALYQCERVWEYLIKQFCVVFVAFQYVSNKGVYNFLAQGLIHKRVELGN